MRGKKRIATIKRSKKNSVLLKIILLYISIFIFLQHSNNTQYAIFSLLFEQLNVVLLYNNEKKIRNNDDAEKKMKICLTTK